MHLEVENVELPEKKEGPQNSGRTQQSLKNTSVVLEKQQPEARIDTSCRAATHLLFN